MSGRTWLIAMFACYGVILNLYLSIYIYIRWSVNLDYYSDACNSPVDYQNKKSSQQLHVQM